MSFRPSARLATYPLNFQHCIAGASIWKFASTDEGLSPDVVLVGIGVEMTFEVIAAAALLRKEIPDLRVRVVNVTDLMILGPEKSHPHSLTDADFINLFTADRFVHFNYHGYPGELRGLLFGRPGTERMAIEGYSEEGTTTTPFDMMLSNRVSRYHVAAAAVRGAATVNDRVGVFAQKLVAEFLHRAQKSKEYAFEHGQGKLPLICIWEAPPLTYTLQTLLIPMIPLHSRKH